MDNFSRAGWLDWETRAVSDLGDVGLDVYLSDPSAKITMANYARGDRKVKLWEPHLNPQIPAELEDMLLDPFCPVFAWGAEFERTTALKLLGIHKPINEWVCVMGVAKYCGLPGKLHDAGEVLELGDQAKMRTGGGKTGKGSWLVKFFGEPTDLGGEETLFGVSQPLFNEPWTHPQEWKTFCEYGALDIVSLRAAAKKLRPFWPSQEEFQTWCLDQKINDTGWPTDQLLIEGAKSIVLRERGPLIERIKEISGIENPNSRDQVLEYLNGQGYGFDSLNKDFVSRALAGECKLTSQAIEVLELRGQTAKSSMHKYTALADMTSADGRLRHQYTYCGAHTHRWAAHGANMGNLIKPTKDVEKRLDLAVDLVRKMDYDSILKEFGKPLEVAASVQRSSFRAPKGKKFVVCDLNAIENRGLGYLARCDAILEVFQKGLDPYLSFAVQMYGDSYEDLLAEYEAGDKTKRTICKAPVLGGGYQLSAGEERINYDTGLPYWTGLMGYARKMGIEMSQADAILSIKTLREAWLEVKWLWKDIELAAAFAIRHPGQEIGVGVPQTQWEQERFDKINRKVQDPLIRFRCHSDKVLEMLLPSNSSMFYWSPRVAKETKKWTGVDSTTGKTVSREYESDSLYYKAKDQKTKQWVEHDTFGGHLVENATQSVCRDVLVAGMKLADQMGFEICGSTYDECITLADESGPLGLDQLRECLTTPLPWAGDAFPLGASGFEDIIYRKD